MDKTTYMTDVTELVKKAYQDGWQSSELVVKHIVDAKGENDNPPARFPQLGLGAVANGLAYSLNYQRPKIPGGKETISLEWGLLRILPGYEDASEILVAQPSTLQGYFQLQRIGEISGILLSTADFTTAKAYVTHGFGVENWVETTGLYKLEKTIPNLLKTAPLTKISNYSKGMTELL